MTKAINFVVFSLMLAAICCQLLSCKPAQSSTTLVVASIDTTAHGEVVTTLRSLTPTELATVSEIDIKVAEAVSVRVPAARRAVFKGNTFEVVSGGSTKIAATKSTVATDSGTTGPVGKKQEVGIENVVAKRYEKKETGGGIPSGVIMGLGAVVIVVAGLIIYFKLR